MEFNAYDWVGRRRSRKKKGKTKESKECLRNEDIENPTCWPVVFPLGRKVTPLINTFNHLPCLPFPFQSQERRSVSYQIRFQHLNHRCFDSNIAVLNKPIPR